MRDKFTYTKSDVGGHLEVDAQDIAKSDAVVFGTGTTVDLPSIRSLFSKT